MSAQGEQDDRGFFGSRPPGGAWFRGLAPEASPGGVWSGPYDLRVSVPLHVFARSRALLVAHW
jgi:hypothetical protein